MAIPDPAETKKDFVSGACALQCKSFSRNFSKQSSPHIHAIYSAKLMSLTEKGT